jgi:hypothetical protein
MRRSLLAVLIFATAIVIVAKPQSFSLKIDQVMSKRELQETGVSTLTPAQRSALDDWLNRYTLKVIEVSNRGNSLAAKSGCSSTVESTIAGDINGWDGETVFKLDNGQIWEQAEYSYTYFYAYRPEVTIYQTNSGCRMKVKDEDETILVRRIK